MGDEKELVDASELVAEIETAYTGRNVAYNVLILYPFRDYADYLEVDLKDQVECVADSIKTHCIGL